MMYRDDHEAALLRIESLQRENDRLARENARLREAPPRSPRTVAPRRVVQRRAAYRGADMTTQEWIVGGLIMAVLVVLNICTC